MTPNQTFTLRREEHDGREFLLLTANEYPYINMQVLTFPADQHDESIERIRTYCKSWVMEYPGRRDFAIIQAGGLGNPDFDISSVHPQQFVWDIKACLEHAAECWANEKDIVEVG